MEGRNRTTFDADRRWWSQLQGQNITEEIHDRGFIRLDILEEVVHMHSQGSGECR